MSVMKPITGIQSPKFR